MLSDHFYHKTIKTAVSVFGTLFNNIKIVNEGTKMSRVPISYAQKDKMLARINSTQDRDFDTNQRVAIQLPRMSFEMSSLTYDTRTSVSMMKRHNHAVSDDFSTLPFRTADRSYSHTPYTLGFQLHVYGKLQDEVLQIVEQILPYFKPDFLVTVKNTGSSVSVWDMPITLNGVTTSDNYEGSYEDNQRTIIYTLDFSTLVRFFGPIDTHGAIRKVNVNVFERVPETIEDNFDTAQVEYIEVEAVPASPSESGYVIQTTKTNTFFDLLEEDNE